MSRNEPRGKCEDCHPAPQELPPDQALISRLGTCAKHGAVFRWYIASDQPEPPPELPAHRHTFTTRYIPADGVREIASGMKCGCGATLSQEGVEAVIAAYQESGGDFGIILNMAKGA